MSSYYQKNREKLIENQLRYYRNNREKCLEYFRAYNRAYYLRHRKTPKPREKKVKPPPTLKPISKTPPPKEKKPKMPLTLREPKVPKAPKAPKPPKEPKAPKPPKTPKAPVKENTLPEYELKPYDMQMDRGMFVLSFS